MRCRTTDKYAFLEDRPVPGVRPTGPPPAPPLSCLHAEELEEIQDRVAELERDNASLREQLEKTAVVVRGGHVTIPDPVGYLVMYCGSVSVGTPGHKITSLTYDVDPYEKLLTACRRVYESLNYAATGEGQGKAGAHAKRLRSILADAMPKPGES